MNYLMIKDIEAINETFDFFDNSKEICELLI